MHPPSLQVSRGSRRIGLKSLSNPTETIYKYFPDHSNTFIIFCSDSSSHLYQLDDIEPVYTAMPASPVNLGLFVLLVTELSDNPSIQTHVCDRRQMSKLDGNKKMKPDDPIACIECMQSTKTAKGILMEKGLKDVTVVQVIYDVSFY